uniref:Uncharacterized protein n=1 Tax=Clytia hemisphaerica TaxID=252671 RepID=A0A7M5XMD5_9CNID
MGNDVNIKQTLVLIIEHIIFNADSDDILKNLEFLQNERQWTIIVFRIGTYYKPIDWLPLNRNIQTQVETYDGFSLSHPVIRTLFNVIKNPDYDVYDMTYRWVMSEKNFFTDDCMKEVRKIIVTVKRMEFLYVPIASAILRKVNAHRSKVNQEPLEIHFSLQYKAITLSSDGHLTVNKYAYHPLYWSHKENNKNHVFIQILDGDRHGCLKSFKRQDFHYRYFLSKEKDRCFGDVSVIKTFGTGEELFEYINDDLCKK